MRPGDASRARTFAKKLRGFAKNIHPLPGIDTKANRDCFVEQLVESVRRVEFVHSLMSRTLSPERADPASPVFDPIRGAIWRLSNGDFEGAGWLVFLSVHFGRNRRTGWRLAANVMRGLNTGRRWDWADIRGNPEKFRSWLRRYRQQLSDAGGGFGNHRKYMSLEPDSDAHTGAAFVTYVNWVVSNGGHERLIRVAESNASNVPTVAFQMLYDSMRAVASFGRTGRFDFLVMLSKLKMASIDPPSLYLEGATGPLTGARLMFGGDTKAPMRKTVLDQRGRRLATALGMPMHVLEDALCNWQKSPGRFIAYRG